MGVDNLALLAMYTQLDPHDNDMIPIEDVLDGSDMLDREEFASALGISADSSVVAATFDFIDHEETGTITMGQAVDVMKVMHEVAPRKDDDTQDIEDYIATQMSRLRGELEASDPGAGTLTQQQIADAMHVHVDNLAL